MMKRAHSLLCTGFSEALTVEGSVPYLGSEFSKEVGALSHPITDSPAGPLAGIPFHHTHHVLLLLSSNKSSHDNPGEKGVPLCGPTVTATIRHEVIGAGHQVVVTQVPSTVKYWLPVSLPRTPSPHSLHPTLAT